VTATVPVNVTLGVTDRVTVIKVTATVTVTVSAMVSFFSANAIPDGLQRVSQTNRLYPRHGGKREDHFRRALRLVQRKIANVNIAPVHKEGQGK
jgi:hypothetical protein